MRIEIGDPARADVLALLEEHLRNMHELSPPESVHALDVSGFKSADMTFWSVHQHRLGSNYVIRLGGRHRGTPHAPHKPGAHNCAAQGPVQAGLVG